MVTARFAGVSGLKNGELLQFVESAGFHVFVSGDNNLIYQQNLERRSIAMIILSAQEWRLIQGEVNKIADAVNRAVRGSFELVECGRFAR